MERISKNWASFIINNRFIVLVVTFITMVISIGMIVTNPPPYNNSSEIWFLEGDPDLEAFYGMQEKFGDSEYMAIGIVGRPGDKDVFKPETIKMIGMITEMLEDHEIVTQVRSLSKYQYTHNENGMLVTDDLFEDIDEIIENPQILDEVRLEKARETILGEKLALDNLISSDLKHTRIVARTEYISGETDHKVKVVTDVMNFLEENKFREKGFEIHLAGVQVFQERFETLSKRDQAWINPIMALIMILILFFTFRSVAGMIFPWVVIASCIAITTGIQAVFGFAFTVMTTALVPTLMIIGMGVSVHVMNEFYNLRSKELPGREAASKTIENLLQPVFFTALTTSIGFGALAVTQLVPVREYAALASSASMIIFLFSMTALPTILSFSNKMSKRTEKAYKSDWATKITNAIPKFTYENRKTIGIISFLVLVFSIITVSNIRVDSNIVRYFKESSWISKDIMYFDKTFKGIANIEYILDSGSDGGAKEPKFLSKVEAFETYLEELRESEKATTLVDFLKQIRQAFTGDDENFYRLPENSNMTAQLLLMYENSGPEEDLSDLKDFDERFVRVTLPVVNMTSNVMLEFMAQTNKYAQDNFGEMRTKLTGPTVMFAAQEKYINEGLPRSFALALILIGISFFVLFRSVKYGLLALIPSVVPIIMAGGVATLIGLNLDLGTLIVGAMTMGIAVDDAIHVVARYVSGRRRGLGTDAAVRDAMNEAGRAVIFTSIILVLGFSTMLFGALTPFVNIGIFTAVIMSLALIGDLIVLPALLYIFDYDEGIALDPGMTTV